MDPRILGAQLNSALFLGFVAWVGVVTAHPNATYMAIAAMGVTYLSYIIHMSGLSQIIGNIVVAVSIVVGAAAGILLLV